MALLFSAVTVTAGYDEAEFTAGGIPREYDDLVGWTAFDDFMLRLLMKQTSAIACTTILNL